MKVVNCGGLELCLELGQKISPYRLHLTQPQIMQPNQSSRHTTATSAGVRGGNTSAFLRWELPLKNRSDPPSITESLFGERVSI